MFGERNVSCRNKKICIGLERKRGKRKISQGGVVFWYFDGILGMFNLGTFEGFWAFSVKLGFWH